MIHVYTGDGKGKTTAAIGLAMRAVQSGRRVAIVYFDKGGDFYSERKMFEKRFADEIDFWACGRARFNPATDQFDFSVTDEDRWEAKRGLEIAREILERAEHDVLILDEINNILHQELVALADVLDLILPKPERIELVLTGRNARPEIMQAADLVTDMRNVKHYMDQGVAARAGIDY
ncbi:MAG: cob(I)yrinic acid a,c-diamide adenosyltransferase [Patescibacteria group bacterium]|nr:cob(I)yrinic acid a,c-diamide adenosyltransferase [Patescibacteria group bacterium]